MYWIDIFHLYCEQFRGNKITINALNWIRTLSYAGQLILPIEEHTVRDKIHNTIHKLSEMVNPLREVIKYNFFWTWSYIIYRLPSMLSCLCIIGAQALSTYVHCPIYRTSKSYTPVRRGKMRYAFFVRCASASAYISIVCTCNNISFSWAFYEKAHKTSSQYIRSSITCLLL